MKKDFRLHKIPVETLIDLLMQLYEGGIDFVDLSADRSDPEQDKLIIFTKESYINQQYYDPSKLVDFEMEEEEDSKKTPIIDVKRLSDDDINSLL